MKKDFRTLIDNEILHAKELIKLRNAGQTIADFDIRGGLYSLALDLAPNSRLGDIKMMREWIKPVQGEVSLDIASGTGFLTKPLAEWTNGKTIAIDPSREQLSYLLGNTPKVETIIGSPDDPATMSQISDSKIDLVTSFGGIHHVEDQRVMMEEIARILKKGGRFVAADVSKGSSLAKHFDEFVSAKCLTGHTGNWLSESRLGKLIEGLPLRLDAIEISPLTWVFENEEQLALFFKGLHAYDLTDQEIINDLSNALGIFEMDGKLHLNWPMMIFKIVKI